METSEMDVTTMMNGIDISDSSYHSNSNIGVEKKENSLFQRTRHIHVGSARKSVTEEVGADTIPVRFRDSGIWVILKGSTNTEADDNFAKKFL